MEPILESIRDAQAKEDASYTGNVPSPPGTRWRFLSSLTSSGRTDNMMNTLLSAADGASPSQQLDDPLASVTPRAQKRQATHLSEPDYVRQLNTVLDDLSLQHGAMESAASSAIVASKDSLRPSSAHVSSSQNPMQYQAQFLRSARRFMELIDIPALRESLAKFSGMNAGATDDLLLSPKSQTLPLLLEEYYDEAGEVKLHGEALVNLDYWYADELAVRIMQQDQEQELTIPDDVFHDDYLRKRAVIELQIDHHISEANRLRDECLRAGIDITAGMRTVGDSDAALSGILVEPREGEGSQSISLSRSELEPLEVAPSEREPRSGGLTPAAKSRSNLALPWSVSRWMDDVDASGEEDMSPFCSDQPPPAEESRKLQHIDSLLVHRARDSSLNELRQAKHAVVAPPPKQAAAKGGATASSLITRSSGAAPGSSTWVMVSKEEVEGIFSQLSLQALDLAARALPIAERPLRRARHELSSLDTKDSSSTNTVRRTWTATLGSTLSDAITWLSSFRSSKPRAS
ncbi:hypothetical protein LTR95_001279 [Oleoguttula sp. CCFEE 5521]